MFDIFARRITTERSFQLLRCAVLVAASLVVSATHAQPPARPAELELTLQVCQEGPATWTAGAERALATADLDATEPLRNPALTVTHQREVEGPTDRETIVGLELPLPLSGRRGLLRDAARARLHAAEARADADSLEAALDFRAAFALAVLEQERVTTMQRHQAALDALAAALAQLKARGEASAYDTLRHRAESNLHARQLSAARARALVARRRLGYWLAALPDAARLTSEALALGPISAQSERAHPLLTELQHAARAAELEVSAAQRRGFPEPDLFAGYRQVSGGDWRGHGLSLGLTVPLPVLDRGQGSAARARAERVLAEARAKRRSRQLQSERDAASASLEPLRTALSLAEQSELEAERLKESARVLFVAGEASISELLDAYRTSEGATLDRLAALEELLGARLAVMRSAGKHFDAELDARCSGKPVRNR